jgi:hypothetical protein
MRALGRLEQSQAAVALSPYYEGLPVLLVASKVVPVLYLKKPQRDPDPVAAEITRGLGESKRLYNDVNTVLKKYREDKPLLRRIFLSQGYLFEDRPEVAKALVREISASDLFDEPVVYKYGENNIQRVEKRGEDYVDDKGNQVKLLLNDRLALGPDELTPPLHLDLAEVRRSTGAQRTLPKVVDEKAAWIDLVFPNGEMRAALVELENGKTRVSCIGGDQETLKRTLAEAADFWERHQHIVWAAELMTAERQRFDEPTDEAEDVQEDGELRLEWSKAYGLRKQTFNFREVEYKVFDCRGNPTPPQVCVDFVFDVWERSTGTWFKRRGKRPGRTQGEIDFSRIPDLSRRNIPSVLEFAADGDTPLERYDIPPKDWVPLKKLRRFAAALEGHAGAFREGDALVIHGLREQDMEEHFHAVLVLSTDPLTGMPMEVGDNQGRPRIGSLYLAMRAAPRRAVKYRLRLDFEKMKKYLESLAKPDAGEFR